MSIWCEKWQWWKLALVHFQLLFCSLYKTFSVLLRSSSISGSSSKRFISTRDYKSQVRLGCSTIVFCSNLTEKLQNTWGFLKPQLDNETQFSMPKIGWYFGHGTRTQCQMLRMTKRDVTKDKYPAAHFKAHRFLPHHDLP